MGCKRAAHPCEIPALNIPGIYSPSSNGFPFLPCGDTAMTFPNVAHDCLITHAVVRVSSRVKTDEGVSAPYCRLFTIRRRGDGSVVPTFHFACPPSCTYRMTKIHLHVDHATAETQACLERWPASGVNCTS